MARNEYQKVYKKATELRDKLYEEQAVVQEKIEEGNLKTLRLNHYLQDMTQNYQRFQQQRARLHQIHDCPTTPSEIKDRVATYQRELNQETDGLRKAYSDLIETIDNRYKPQKVSKSRRKVLTKIMGLEETLQRIMAETTPGTATAVFLLVAASASFGYALQNAVFNTANSITGSVVGIMPVTEPSLLLSTLAMMIIIWIVAPSGSLKNLIKK